ncbi:MAG: hypothetical protein LBU12_00380 [Deltaproteobacteria bacterium]|jgi:uncharacterized protein YfaS (alpha-2-macroglobulin family)|nr:hypothetical protein [Deltaproteobacteria bacterium]
MSENPRPARQPKVLAVVATAVVLLVLAGLVVSLSGLIADPAQLSGPRTSAAVRKPADDLKPADDRKPADVRKAASAAVRPDAQVRDVPQAVLSTRKWEDGGQVMLLTYDRFQVASDEVGVVLGIGEGPLELTSGPSGVKVHWENRSTLCVNLGLSPEEWGAFLGGGGELAWRFKPGWDVALVTEYDERLEKELKELQEDRTRTEIESRQLLRTLKNMPRFWLQRFEIVADGPRAASVSIKGNPPAAQLLWKRERDDLVVTIVFNREMVDAAQVGRYLIPDQDQPPVTITPALGLIGRWTSQSEFELATAGFGDKAYWEQIVDVPFKAALRPDLKTLDGRPAGEAALWAPDEELIFDSFKVLDVDEAGFDDEGRLLIDMTVNKPMKVDELASAAVWTSVSGGRGDVETVLEQRAAYDRSGDGTADAGGLAGLDGESGEIAQSGGGRVIELLGVVLDGVVADRAGGEAAGLTARWRLPAEQGERLKLRLSGLKSADGRGQLDELTGELQVDFRFAVQDAYLDVESKHPFRTYFVIRLENDLAPDQDLASFVTLDPPLPFTVETCWGGLRIFAPFGGEREVRLTLKKGLRSESGLLNQDASWTIDRPAPESRLTFLGDGRYVAARGPKLVKLAGRDADLVRLQAWRIHESNLPFILNVGALDSEDEVRLGQQLSEKVLDVEAPTGAVRGEVFERLVDLSELLGPEVRGAYVLKALPLRRLDDGSLVSVGLHEDEDYQNPWNDASDYWLFSGRYLPATVTDLGLAAKTLPGSTTVFVSSLSAARPLAGVRVRLYDRANQIAAEGLTGADGLWTAPTGSGRAVFLTAERDGDLSWLALGEEPRELIAPSGADRPNSYDRWFTKMGGWLPTPETAGADVCAAYGCGEYLQGGYEVLAHLPRGVYKPGETVEVKALVRDKRIRPPAGEFPLVWRLVDPDGRAVAQGRSNLDVWGGLHFKAALPFSARTGQWRAVISAPGSETVLGQADFLVDDFVPPRIELALAAEPERLEGPRRPVRLAGRADWLFGAPGAGLDWEMRVSARALTFAPAGWEAFDFAGAALDAGPWNWQDLSGELDAEGRLALDYEPYQAAEDLPPSVEIIFDWRVMDDAGRWTGRRAKLPWLTREVFTGLKLPAEAVSGRRFEVELAAIQADGRPAELETLVAEVFRVRRRGYNLVVHGTVRRSETDDLEPLASVEVRLAEGRGRLDFVPPAPGLYEVAVTTPQAGTVRRRLTVVGLTTQEEAAEPQAYGKLETFFEKAVHQPGETARALVKLPFEDFSGPVWVTLETDELLHSAVIQAQGSEIALEVPVPVETVQNAHLTAAAVRPVSADGQAQGWLTVGRASLEMDRRRHELLVELDAPERLTPSTKVKLRVRLTDPDGRPLAGELSAAFVDVAVLDLTGHRAPDPAATFLRSRRPLGRLHAMHDQILPQLAPSLPFLAAGGGDSDESGHYSPFRRNQLILSLFVPSAVAGPDGWAEVELDVPEYSGEGRLTVTASSGDRFGTWEKRVRVARELTVEPTAPLALAPGDEFEASARIFLAPEARPGEPTAIALSTDGPLAIVSVEGEDGPIEDWRNLSLALAPGRTVSLKLRLKAAPSPAAADPGGGGRVAGGGGLGGAGDAGGGLGGFGGNGGAEGAEGAVGSADAGDADRTGLQAAFGGLVGRAAPTALTGPAALIVEASRGVETFAQRAETVVRPPYPRVSRSFGGQVEGARQSIELSAVGFLPGTVKASLTLTSGPAAELLRALEYLADYPYGCLEQTVSQAWPYLAAEDLQAFVSKGEIDSAEMALRTAVARVATMQTFRGGFAPWPGGREIYGWGSVYAAHFLTEASRRTELPKGLLEDALDWLRASLPGDFSGGDDDDDDDDEEEEEDRSVAALAAKAYAVYVLNLNGDPQTSWVNYLKRRGEALPPSAEILLAGAEALRLGRSDPLVELEGRLDRRTVRWPLGPSLETPARNLALRLLVWNEVDPLHPRARELAVRVAADGRRGDWLSTQENGLAVLALGGHLKKSAAGEPYRAEIRAADGSTVATAGHLDPGGAGPEQLAGRLDGPLTVVVDGPGRPWWSASVSGAPLAPPAPKADGLTLQRVWRVEDDAYGPAEEFALNRSEDFGQLPAFRRGRRVAVTLTVESTEDADNVVVADLTPGGFEFVGLAEGESNDVNRLELREDRAVAIFSLRAGQRTSLTYHLRAVTPGRFVLPPTAAEEMYRPQRQAVLASGTVAVQDGD